MENISQDPKENNSQDVGSKPKDKLTTDEILLQQLGIIKNTMVSIKNMSEGLSKKYTNLEKRLQNTETLLLFLTMSATKDPSLETMVVALEGALADYGATNRELGSEVGDIVGFVK